MNKEEKTYPVPDRLLESWVRSRGLDLLENCVVFLDEDLRVSYVNQSFLDTFKLKSSETVGHYFLELDDANWDIPQIRKLLEETLQENTHCLNFEVAHRFPSIGIVPMVINAYRWETSERGNTATVLVIQSLVADRAETKGLHDALIRSLSDMGEGMLIIQNRRISFVNHTLCDIVGLSAEVILGMPTFLELFHPDERDRIAERHSARLAGETFATCYETALLHKNGNRVEVDISVATLQLENNPGVVITIRDITTRKQFELALLESEERHRTFIEKLSDGVCVTVDNRIVFANPSLAKITGYPLVELTGMHLTQLVLEEDWTQLNASLEEAITGKPVSADLDFRFRHRNGEMIYIRLSHALVEWEKSRGVLTTISDITDRKKMEAELIESRNRLHTLISASPVPLLLKRVSDNTILFINQHAADLFGLDLHGAVGQPAPEFGFPEGDGQISNQTLNRYGVLHNYEVTLKSATGATVWAIMSEQSMVYDGEKSILVAFYDITSRKQAENRMEYLATHDSLTDLPNRKLLFERLQQAVRYGQRYGNLCAILYLDLDGFKSVNDTLGHAAGDVVLLEVSHRLQQCVRSSDTVARIGGDEFIIFLVRIEDPQQAAGVAEKVIDCIRQPLDISGKNVTLGVSIGIGVFGLHGRDADSLVNNADSAMYTVKSRGKNGFAFYDPVPEA